MNEMYQTVIRYSLVRIPDFLSMMSELNRTYGLILKTYCIATDTHIFNDATVFSFKLINMNYLIEST